jgi:glutamate carboxypeptidase
VDPVTSFQRALPHMLRELEVLVCCESPSSDTAALRRCAGLVAELGGRLLGAPAEQLDLERPGLRWRFGRSDRVLLLGHLDTVWPLGSLRIHPFTRDDDVIRGPGCFDMKAGLVQMLHAVAALPERDGVTILVTSDEEIGSPASRPVIEEHARAAAAALVLEASADGGALKSARKGVSTFEIDVVGRAAHAGLEPERGVNASVELAHQVLRLVGLADPELGTSVTPSVLAAGSTVNTVPATGRVHVDVRAFTVAEQRRVADALERLAPVLPGAQLRVVLGEARPPLPPSASADLLAAACSVAARLGLPPLEDVAVGGGSDGNLTAGVGTPTLDGLGAVGGGAHADDEHVLITPIPARTALLSELVRDLLAR